MAYEKQTWKTGDVVTSAKLNHMEDGISNASTLVIGGFSYSKSGGLVGTSDKTWQEIDNALAAGARCIIAFADPGGHMQVTLDSTVVFEGEYRIYASSVSGFSAVTTSADGYPSAEGQDGQ